MQQQPMSRLLPPELDPTSELYADAIKYVMQPHGRLPVTSNSSLTSLTSACSESSELHLQHATAYTAKIRDFVDKDPVSKPVLRAKQAALFNIVESHEKFGSELLANEHHPFSSKSERLLALRMLENVYTRKEFEQQVEDTKLLQPELKINAEKILQKLNTVPT